MAAKSITDNIGKPLYANLEYIFRDCLFQHPKAWMLTLLAALPRNH